MKVLQLGPYPPPHGGVQTNLVAIRELLLRQNIPCAVINITRHRKPEADEIYYPSSALQLLRRMRGLRCDIVHLHIGGNVTHRLLGLALACCSMPGSKAVLTFHSGGYPSSPAGQATGPSSLAAFVFRRFDRIIAVNQQIVDFFCRLAVPRQRIALIYPHPLPSVNDSTPPLSANLREFYAAHHPVLISVGLLEPEYDLALQIEAIGRIRGKFPRAGLVLIGSGSLEPELRTRIAANPHREHILLCGDLPHDVTLRAIVESDLMLRTTLYDGDAVSVREALHLGVPVIATDNGMRPAGIHLIPAQSPGALLAQVERVLSSPRAALPASTASDNIQAVIDTYRQLIGPESSPVRD
jgi:glycosyltransferase involved in cell wall biosynthesis